MIVIPAALPLPVDRSQDWRLLVFANGLLLDDFDRRSFAAYQRQLSYTHAQEIDALDRLLGAKPRATRRLRRAQPLRRLLPPFAGLRLRRRQELARQLHRRYNPGQENCDGDTYGNICDGTNGIFQNTIDIITCMTDKDLHFGYFDFEHHVEQRQFDVSSCNAPDRWNRWIRDTAQCAGVISDADCCEDGLGNSIEAVGDDVGLWCGSRRDTDYCH